MTFSTEKLEWHGYPMVKTFWRYAYSFSQNTRTWQTDRHRTTAALMHSIMRQQTSPIIVLYEHLLVCTLSLNITSVHFCPSDVYYDMILLKTYRHNPSITANLFWQFHNDCCNCCKCNNQIELQSYEHRLPITTLPSSFAAV